MAYAPQWAGKRYVVKGASPASATLIVHEGSSAVSFTSGTYTLTRPAGTDFVAAAVTTGTFVASGAIGDASAETIGDDWIETWTMVIDGVTEVFQREVSLVLWVPRLTVTDDDLYRIRPELRDLLPKYQTSWEPQRVEAFDQLMTYLVQTGQSVQRIAGPERLRTILLYSSLAICCDAISPVVGSKFQDARERYELIANNALEQLTVNVDTDDDGVVDADGEGVQRHAANSDPTGGDGFGGRGW